MSKRSNTNSNHERFLASMTFSSMFGNCDCDECDEGNCPAPDSADIPPQISEAVKDYKRQRVVSASQERILTARNIQYGVSIWELVMPPGAEPLMEFGSSHRFVLVTQMPRGRIVKIIGKGIVGSSSEKNSRRQLQWSEQSAYFYSSNPGKSIGWTNEKEPLHDKTADVNGEQDQQQQDDESDILEGSADIIHDIVLYIIKATPQKIQETKDLHSTSSDGETETWTKVIIELFQKYTKESNVEDKGDSIGKNGMEINSDDADVLRSIIDDFVSSRAKEEGKVI